MNKKQELTAIIVEYSPEIICITEFAPKHTRTPLQEAELQLEGYDIFSNIGSQKRGVIIYTRRDLQASPSSASDIWESDEGCWCEVKLKDEDKLLIGCVYRSPNSNAANNEKMMSDIRTVCNTVSHTHLLLCGDFNIPGIDWTEETPQSNSNSLAWKFTECVRDCFLHQHVKDPTHSRQNQAENILDLVFTNEEGMVDVIQHDAPLGKSDHLVLKFSFSCYKDDSQPSSSKFLYHKGNYEEINKEIARHQWSEEMEEMSVEESWNLIETRLTAAMEKHIPKSRPTTNKKRKPLWMNDKVFVKVKKKSAAFKRYQETKEGEDYNTYAKARNQAKWTCRAAVREFEKNLAKESKTNPKAFYNYTRNMFKTNASIPDLDMPDGRKTTNEKEKANLLNDFFSSVFTREDLTNMPEFERRKVTFEMENLTITENMVTKKLKGLNPNKAGGMDGISPRVLIETADTMNTPVTLLLNKTLTEGQLPQRWKDAMVTPLFKKGKKSAPGNYRPVSLTSVLCKVSESIIRDQIMDHLYRNKLLSERQHGFVRKRSCMTQLLECLDDWTEMIDNGGNVDVIYMDYAKAFDKVAHERLLLKLRGYGLNSQIISWIKSFLSNRRQKVKVNGEESTWAEVLSGVPQGSVLGPVLFVCYINDLPDNIKTNVRLFADDTKVYAEATKSNNRNNLQEDVTYLDKWANIWQLSFNAGKCKTMHIGAKNPNQSYHMIQDGTRVEIETTHLEKDIGVYVDDQLKFDQHIETKCKQANKILGMVRRSFTFINKDIMRQLYIALIRPILEYGHVITYPRLKKSEESLEKIQHRATKMVPELKEMEYEQRLREMKLQSLYYRRDRGDMIECYKMTHDCYDINPILRKGENNLRGHSHKLQIQGSSKEVRHNFFSLRCVSNWNSLPEEVVSAPSLDAFKSRLDKHWNVYHYCQKPIKQLPLPPCINV